MTDSGVDTTLDSDMESVTSSMYAFRHDGRRRSIFAFPVADRRYHAVETNRYPLPNDEEETMRLDELHYLYRSLLGGNVVVPIGRKASSILDVGTGSGRWAIE